MPRPRLPRVAAALIAAWFLVLVTEPGALATCAMHSGGKKVAATVDVHAGHAGHTETQDEPKPGACCTCLSHCCVAPVVVAPAAIESVVATIVRAFEQSGRPEHEYRGAWTDFVLPFSTAPPLLAS